MFYGIILLTGAYPLHRAWRANRGWTLRHALVWAWIAWAAWGVALLLADRHPGAAARLAVYFALCLTGCASVAVLGARRPGVTAWNFVVLAQLAVLLLPLAENLGELHLSALWVGFLSATLAIGVLNYLPTRRAAVAVAVALGCAVELGLLVQADAGSGTWEQLAPYSRALLVASPWLAWLQARIAVAPPAMFDQIWFGFRDHYGLVWGQRVREQFNRAAENAGWPVVLRWNGLRAMGLKKNTRSEQIEALRALLKRFVRST